MFPFSVMVFIFICGSAIAEIVPTNDETNVPFLGWFRFNYNHQVHYVKYSILIIY